MLREHNVLAVVGEVVERLVNPDVGGRVDQGAGAAPDVGVLALAIDNLLDLLHVGGPVDFGVGDLLEDDPAEQRVEEPERAGDNAGQPMVACGDVAGESQGLGEETSLLLLVVVV